MRELVLEDEAQATSRSFWASASEWSTHVRSCAHNNPRAARGLWELWIVVEIEVVWAYAVPIAHRLSTAVEGRKCERGKLIAAALHISRPSTTATKYFKWKSSI